MRLLLQTILAKSCAIMIALVPTIAPADVSVSDDFHRWAMKNQMVSVRPGKWSAYKLDVAVRGSITVDARIRNDTFNDGSVYICDEASFRRFEQKQSNNCVGESRKRQRIKFIVPASTSGTYYLILDNRFSILNLKHYDVSVIIPDRMNPQFQHFVTTLLKTLDQYVQSTFQAPDFELSVKSCGESNAYSNTSTGDIVLCSEFLFEASEHQSAGMIAGITFHEIGHSLLSLWGLPNNANEETVDEFATYMLLHADDPSLLIDYIEYWERQNSWAEATRVIKEGGTHPLSAQRARNVRRNMQNATEFSERWNRLIYPHMTDAALISIIKSPNRYSTASIARQVLNARGVVW